MNNKTTTTLFWFTALAILLLSIIFYRHFDSGNFGTSSLNEIRRYFQFEDIFPVLGRIVYRRHHHHQRHHHQHGHRDKSSCDHYRRWDSSLVSLYNVSVVVSVDLNGCTNYSSVQKAIDAMPDFSRSWMLITVDSGTYRYVKK